MKEYIYVGNGPEDTRKDEFLPILNEYKTLITGQVLGREKSPFLSKLANVTGKQVEGADFIVGTFLQKLDINTLIKLQRELPEDENIKAEIEKRKLKG